MISAIAPRPVPGSAPKIADHRSGCGGARILDLALCMIVAVTFVGLLMLAL